MILSSRRKNIENVWGKCGTHETRRSGTADETLSDVAEAGMWNRDYRTRRGYPSVIGQSEAGRGKLSTPPTIFFILYLTFVKTVIYFNGTGKDGVKCWYGK